MKGYGLQKIIKEFEGVYRQVQDQTLGKSVVNAYWDVFSVSYKPTQKTQLNTFG